jgi:HSP20 family molecular chaperone IbpA
MAIFTATKKKEEQASAPISCQNTRAKDRLHDHTSKRAYELYEQAGREHGQHNAHWHQAQSEVAKKVKDVHESASWYTFNYPVDGFKPEDIHVSVEPDAATVLAEQLHLAGGQEFDDSLVSRESFFLVAHWPSEVDVSTANAYVKDGVLSVTAKRAQIG